MTSAARVVERCSGPEFALQHTMNSEITVVIAAEPAAIAIDVARTAFVIIDMQRDFLEPGGFASRRPVDDQGAGGILGWVSSAAAIVAALGSLPAQMPRAPASSSRPQPATSTRG